MYVKDIEKKTIKGVIINLSTFWFVLSNLRNGLTAFD